ncbi:hypothetical protein PQX77_021557 [Marasmius sp. AFHP31]|nr:hypothetical protein PQX77_021557 [Marasmius sp. AFHP31]
MADPIPYNLTIPSQAASLAYFPLVNPSSNNTDEGWVLSYSGGLVPDASYWGRRGIGADYHATTRKGSTVQISWIGTGIYFYGNATSDGYKIKVDGDDVQEADVPNGGLLGSKTDLPYKKHTSTLTVIGGKKVAFQYAQVTIGYGYPGNSIENRTIQAVSDDGNTPNNNYFNFVGKGWRPENPPKKPRAGITFPNGTETKISYQMKTNLTTSSLRFKVNNASGFVLLGSMFSDHNPKRATITPDPTSNTRTKSTDIYDICSMLDFEQVLYWESNLDYSTTYTMDISNIDPDRNSYLAFNKLELLDGGPAPSKSSSGGFNPLHVRFLKVVSLIALAALVVGILFWRRRRKQQKYSARSDDAPETPTNASECSIDPFPPPISTNPSREVDAGPLSTLPPEYDDSWVGDQRPHEGHGTVISSELDTSGVSSERLERRAQDQMGRGKRGLRDGG